MTEQFREAIRALRANTQPTKSAVVRTLLPEIEAARIAGYRLKAIWQCVRDSGLDVTYAQFCVYLRRARARPTQWAPRVRTEGGTSSPADQGRGADPLANVRRRQSTRPGFHYRGTEDLDVLVHGRKKDDRQ